MEGKFTVYFDDPVWVGVCERQGEAGYSLARIVFGSEPGEAELYQFIQAHYTQFEFSQPVKPGKITEERRNYKRVQREVRQSMRAEGVGTKAQDAMKLALAQNQKARQQQARQQRQENAEAHFRQRQQKKREKQRGH